MSFLFSRGNRQDKMIQVTSTDWSIPFQPSLPSAIFTLVYWLDHQDVSISFSLYIMEHFKGGDVMRHNERRKRHDGRTQWEMWAEMKCEMWYTRRKPWGWIEIYTFLCSLPCVFCKNWCMINRFRAARSVVCNFPLQLGVHRFTGA